MPDIKKINSIYFLGIGGIGMSALARYFLQLGKKVHGYDKTLTSLTSALEAEGMKIHYEENISLIPGDTDLVIYTPAVPKEHAEYRYFLEKSIPVYKRAEILGLISSDYSCIAVAGTHGKTTTTTLCAHIFSQSPQGCLAFLGGISKNYGSNLINSQDSRYMIAEADEFDRSFLHLHPQIAVITSIDADHLDIYGNHAAMLETFSDFSANIIEGGFLILKYGLELPLKLKDRCHVYSYSATGKGDFTADSVRLVEGLYHFDFRHPSGCIPDMVLGLPGLYNVENAVAALAASWLCGVEEGDLRQGLKTFQGVCRRFDIRINRKELVYIDDYAHHPAELRACITAARRLFPQKKLTGIFQPHLYTRTRDFADEFAESLDLLDEVILLPVYPARELPIEGINSEMLLSKMSLLHKKLVQKEDIPANLNAKNLEVLLTLGAGDIDTLVEKIENHFNSPIKTV